MQERIAALVEALLKARSFEQASAFVLRPMLEIAEQQLAQSPFARSSNILRGMIHLRPVGGYRGLVVLEKGAKKVSAPGRKSPLLPSATAWKWIETHHCAVSVDVLMGTIRPVSSKSSMETQDESTFDSAETMQRLLSRDATHLHTIPMRSSGGVIHGMISLEVRCQQAMGQDFIWKECAEALQLLADISTPTLTSLPLSPPTVVRDDPLLPVVGQAMASIVALLQVFAQQNETILISGPTGAGKSRLAMWVHGQSSRRDGPFQVVDLLTIPEDMQMAHLFGWKRGAFTGAVRDQVGCVARASAGTLFIDEIDKLSLKAQAGLLQLLETRRYRVLGGGEDRANVRFIIGTNADLKASVANGSFREDLYYRINVLPVRLPPLVERGDEIPSWAHFMVSRRFLESGKRGRVILTADAGLALTRYPWPGNLRQLDNVIRRAYAMALVEQGANSEDLAVDVRHVERALAFESGSKDQALIDALQRAAMAYVDEAERRSAQGQVFDLGYTSAFRGLVLSAAMHRLKDLKKVFILFGKNKLVETRNHNKEFKRDTSKMNKLCEELGEDPEMVKQFSG